MASDSAKKGNNGDDMPWFEEATQCAQTYLATIDDRAVFPLKDALEQLSEFQEAFPETSTDPLAVIQQLDRLGSPATVATTGPRYFGFVTGGILPAATGANILMSAWDQNGSSVVSSPISATLEGVALQWIVEALDLAAPQKSDDTATNNNNNDSMIEGALVTGATMANFTALAAARHHLLKRKGWDVEAQGLFGAPEITVIVGQEVHASLLQALQMVGFGKDRVIRVPVDSNGAILASALPPLDPDQLTLICLQAGNVNTGAFDPALEICEKAKVASAWVHVDGAFGIWVRATETHKHLGTGIELADSWAADAHKWLNVSYDNGIVLCKHPEALKSAMTVHAPYFVTGGQREPNHFSPEQSRRSRGIEVWAALKSLGNQGLRQLVERDCQLATQFANGLREAGFEVLNEVVINQILVAFGNDDETTRRIIAEIQQEGTLWAGPSVWKGRTGMRISVSSWKTTPEDIDRCIAAIVKIAGAALTARPCVGVL